MVVEKVTYVTTLWDFTFLNRSIFSDLRSIKFNNQILIDLQLCAAFSIEECYEGLIGQTCKEIYFYMKNSFLKSISAASDPAILLTILIYLNWGEIFNAVIISFGIFLFSVILLFVLQRNIKQPIPPDDEGFKRYIIITFTITKVIIFTTISYLYLSIGEVLQSFGIWGILSIVIFFVFYNKK